MPTTPKPNDLSAMHETLSHAAAKCPPDVQAKVKPLLEQLGAHPQTAGTIDWASLIKQILDLVLPYFSANPPAPGK